MFKTELYDDTALIYIQMMNEELLLEDRIDFLKEKNPNIDSSHDTLAVHKNANDIIDHFATNADPTKNKIHTQWILGQYKQKNIRQEDAPRIKDSLNTFEKYKSKLDKKDINQYKSLGEVEDSISPFVGTHASKRAEDKEIKTAGADLIHKDGDFSVHHIKTEEAAKLYGKGTKWCTAADNNNNMFGHYNKEGKLFVVQHKGEKYQYHRESGQFMNDKDEEITPSEFNKIKDPIHASWDKHPEIAPPKNSKMDWKYGNKSEADISDALNDSNYGVRRQAIEHPNATEEHISKALNDSDEYVRWQAIKHPNATPEHISKALNDSYYDVRWQAIQHPKATEEHISKALNDSNDGVRKQAIEHPNATPENISKALNDSNDGVRWQAIKHPNATTEHISKALDDSNEYVRMQAIKHPNATTEHISKALKDSNYDVREQAIGHPKATPDHISKALDDSYYNVRKKAIKHPNATTEHISKALNDSNYSVRMQAIGHPKATEEHISKALNDSDSDVRMQAIGHPKATEEHISKALDDSYYNVRKKAIKHPNATPEHISKALNDSYYSVRWNAKRLEQNEQ